MVRIRPLAGINRIIKKIGRDLDKDGSKQGGKSKQPVNSAG